MGGGVGGHAESAERRKKNLNLGEVRGNIAERFGKACPITKVKSRNASQSIIESKRKDATCMTSSREKGQPAQMKNKVPSSPPANMKNAWNKDDHSQAG
jgi:hypothetical protein